MTFLTASTLLIFGAGGHGRVVCDAAMGQGTWARLIASDREPSKCTGQLLPGVDLMEMSDAVPLGGLFHVAIGHNASREREALALGPSGWVTISHRSAVIAKTAVLSRGCFVAANATVAPLAQLGSGVIINHGAVVDHEVVIDDFTHVAPGAVLAGSVRLGKRVLVGAGAIVLPGVSIADDVILGAGCVVSRAINVAGVYAGVPARKLK